MTGTTFDVEQAVHHRYSLGAMNRVDDLCCPVDYDPRHLEVIPPEILQRDYGCGDPSRHLMEGETVLDLGSGTGKICYIASQVVGPGGRVIGVDMNSDMLALARKHLTTVGDRIGWHNVEFRRGRIQDLRLDLDAVERWLAEHPVRAADDLAALESEQFRLRNDAPLVTDASVDVIVSNCVLNLMSEAHKSQLFPEMYRVLTRGGRVIISDIVADEPVPEHLKANPELWSGCISGAMTETAFLDAFEQAGFHGVEILSRQEAPWRTVEGIEFRSVTLRAFKGKDGPCHETNKAVMYRGPWKQVVDDDGHVFRRGERTAVCEKTFQIMMQLPYAGRLDAIVPREPVEPGQERPFDCSRKSPRHPRETKGVDYDATTAFADQACSGPDCC